MSNKTQNELIVLEEVKYPVTTNELEAFKAKWEKVPVLVPEDGIKDETYLKVRKAKFEAVKFRTSIENTRKLLKAPALEYGSTVDRIAKEMKAIVEDTESKLTLECAKVEQYEAQQEQLRIEAENKRVNGMGEKITALRMIPGDAVGKSKELLIALYGNINIPEEKDFYERTEEALTIYKEVMEKLETMIQTAGLAEQAAEQAAKAEAIRKKEDEEREAKQKAEREAFEAEKAAFREEQDAAARIVQAEQEEINRQKAEAEAEELEAIQRKEAEEAAREATNKAAASEALNNKNLQEAKVATHSALMDIAAVHDTDYNLVANIVEAIINGEIPNVKWEVN